MHALVLLRISQQHTKFEMPTLPFPKIWLGQNLKTAHITLTTPIRVIVCHQKASTYIFHLQKYFGDSRFSRSGDMIVGVEIKKWVMWPRPCPFKGWFVIVNHKLGYDIVYLCTKFDHSSFIRSRVMVGAHQNLNGSRDLTTSLSEMICHSRASTCYSQYIYQICSL